jgi:hypothetical protein
VSAPLPRRRLRLGHAVLAAAVAAAVFRLAYVADVHDHPFWRVPLVDAADYHARAVQVMRGEGLGTAVYYKAPAYAWFLGGLYRLAGGPRIEVAFVVQMLGGVWVAAATAALGGRAFGAAAGLIAGLAAGLYAPLPYYENQLLIEPAALAVSVAAAYAACRGPGLARWARRRGGGLGLDIAAGVLCGVTLQLRPANAAFVLALLVWVWLSAPRTDWLRRTAAIALPVLLLLMPTLRHNRQATGHIVPVSVNGGINYYIGNNPDYDATVAIRPGLRWEELTQRFGAMDDPVQWQRNFYAAAFTWMRHHPSAWLRLQVRKLVLFWNRAEIDRNQDSSAMQGDSAVLRLGLPWSLLAIFALVGAWVTRGVARREPAHVLALGQMLGVIAFFVTTRYRMMAIPWIAVLAGAGCVWAVRTLAARAARRRVAALAALVAAALAVLPPWWGSARAAFGRPEFDRAEVLARRGDARGALAAYAAAAARHPDDPDVRFRYGEQLHRLGQETAAIAEYARATALAPWSYKPPLAWGAALLAQGDLDAAWQALAEAERRGDPKGRALYDMALVRERQARHAEALELFVRSLERIDDKIEMIARHRGAARMLEALGRPEAARVHTTAAASLES